MEREKILRFAAKSFDDFPDGLNIVELEQFARLVEQETLERAAKKCEDIAYMMGGSVGAMDCALSIRNLKPPQ